jgi:DNA-binding transcriptional ArsR family regulator
VAKQSSSAADRRAARAARATPTGTRVQKGDESMAPALDRIIHERVRLGIVSALAANERLTFNELKALLHTSDGNVSVHARKLEDAGYLACAKSFDGRVPKTEYKLTSAGRKALERYFTNMEALIQATRGK